MSDTISIRLPKEVRERLDERAKRTGRSRNAIVNEAVEQSLAQEPKAFMALAGSMDGPANLSQRKGFAEK